MSIIYINSHPIEKPDEEATASDDAHTRLSALVRFMHNPSSASPNQNPTVNLQLQSWAAFSHSPSGSCGTSVVCPQPRRHPAKFPFHTNVSSSTKIESMIGISETGVQRGWPPFQTPKRATSSATAHVLHLRPQCP